MKLSLTPRTLIDASRKCLKRFPVTLGFVVLLTAYMIYLIWERKDYFSAQQTFSIFYYLSVGSLLSLTLQVWGEEVKRSSMVLTANLAAHALLLADAIYLYRLPESGQLLEVGIAHGAALTTLGFSLFILPFFREKEDVCSKNFAVTLCMSAIVSGGIGLIMWGGLSLLTRSLTELFGIEISHRCYETLAALCDLLLPALLLLGLIPQGKEKFNRQAYTSGYLLKVIRFLIFPLLGCYLLVLYLYAAKILVNWELPNGWVSWLTVTLMVGCIGVEFILYPSNRYNKHSFEQRVAHWLPLCILPLLVLMSIGIARRFNDYGITVNRLYLATLNGWFYLVCLGLFFIRARRIHWIPISFALLFLLTSVIPYANYTNYTRRHLLNDLRNKIESTYHGILPMNEENYLDWLSTFSREEATNINSQLRYLDYKLDDPHVEEWLKNGYRNYWGAEQFISKHCLPAEGETSSTTKKRQTDAMQTCESDSVIVEVISQLIYNIQCTASGEFPLSEGYSRIARYYQENSQLSCGMLQKEIIALPLPVSDNRLPDSVYISRFDLDKWQTLSPLSEVKELRCSRKGNRFFLTGLRLEGIDKEDTSVKCMLSGVYLIK